MKRQLMEKELSVARSFLIEAFEFTEEQSAAIHHRVPMTQELYDSILDRCSESGKDAGGLFYAMLDEYPDIMKARADRIEKEVLKADIPSLPPEKAKKMKRNIYAEIRKRYGENAV